MATQKAIVIKERFTSPILIADHPVTTPAPNQVKVKVTVAALNPHDQKTRDEGLLLWSDKSLPWICASDVVGRITSLGFGISSSSNSLEVGDRIMFFSQQFAPNCAQAGLQEYAVVDGVGGAMCKVPNAWSDDEAATVPTNLTTAFVALFVDLGIKVPWEKDGEVPKALLVVGGGSNTGRFAVQLARMAGVERVVVVGGKEEEIKALGATHVVDRHQTSEEVVRQVKRITNDELIFALDCINEPDGLGPGFAALSNRKKGRLARLIPRDDTPEAVTKGHKLINVRAGMKRDDPRIVKMWQRLPGWMEKGEIKPGKFIVAGGLDAGTVNKAMDGYRDEKSAGQPHFHVAS